MNIKKVFGAILTGLGIAGLISAAIVFTNMTGGIHETKEVVIYSILGLVFFVSGIILIKTMKG